MKSVFEEAASVAKAIEKGWIKAGQPQKFSVTILEKPEKNFIGMVKKSAKVGVFFEDRKESDTRRYQPQRGQRRPQGRVQLPQQRGGERRSGYQQRSSSRPQQQGRPPQRDPQSQPYPDKRKPVASVHQPPQPTQETRPTEKKSVIIHVFNHHVNLLISIEHMSVVIRSKNTMVIKKSR